MRVLIVHNFYQIPGGEDSIVREEMSMLADNGFDIELFSVTNTDIKGALGGITTALQVVYNAGARRALSKKLAEFLPDIVHIHNFFPLLSPSIFDACLEAGVPSVLTLHNFRILCPTALLGSDDRDRQRSLGHTCWWTVPKKAYRNSAAATLALATMIEFHKWFGTWTRKVDRFIVLSDYARRIFVEGGLPNERIIVKPSCVARPSTSVNLPRHGALFVGRLDEQKGIGILLRAWKDLDYPLRIIGDGPLSGVIQQSRNDRITYLGRQPREIVNHEMQTAKFLVLPSMGNEMLPVTVLEAFSSRLPVICSDLPSLRGLVEPGATGLTFPPGDSEACAAQVRNATGDASLFDQFGDRAQAVYEERYTPEVNLSQLVGIYETLRRSRRRLSGLEMANKSGAPVH